MGIAVFTVWACLALLYQLPGGIAGQRLAAVVFAALSIGVVIALFRRHALWSFGFYLTLCAALMVWWISIPPSNARDWADEVSQMTSGTIDGDRFTIRNVRNFDWRTEQDYTARWETRTYDLSTLTSVDLILSYWASPAIAHTLVSFGFSDGNFVTFSVEIRKERGERFSEIGGFFKQFETSVVAADERDIVRLRTNVRKEDVYLYRVIMPAPAIQSLFLSYIEEANSLAYQPRFYHTITANCTTVVFAMVTRIISGLPFDYRLILSGYLPEYLERIGGFTPGFDIAALRAAGAISKRAQAAGNDPAYSQIIRQGVPGTTP